MIIIVDSVRPKRENNLLTGCFEPTSANKVDCSCAFNLQRDPGGESLSVSQQFMADGT